ncbi:MAG: hypothetical protein NVSMB2_22640 [Chloroflexota bacterium]
MAEAARVFVVEDDDTIRHVLVIALEDEGYDVRQAVNGQMALDMLETETCDLILLDLMLPVLDGVGFLEQAQLRGLTNDVPVVVLSASRRAQEATATYAACAATIAKPFDLADLLETLERIIAARSAPHRSGLEG